MSNRRRLHPRPQPDPLAGIMTALDGLQVPGGCEHCDAYQTAACDEPGVYRITVHHDDWCPQYGPIGKAAGG